MFERAYLSFVEKNSTAIVSFMEIITFLQVNLIVDSNRLVGHRMYYFYLNRFIPSSIFI